MKGPFKKDNPYISIGTCFLSNSYTLVTAYHEVRSRVVFSVFKLKNPPDNRKTIRQLIHTNEQTRICVCAYIRIFIRTYAYVYTHIRVYLYAHTRLFIRTYAYTYTHIRVYIYAHTRIFIPNYARFLVNVYLSGTVSK